MKSIIETLKALPTQIHRAETDLARSTVLVELKKDRLKDLEIGLWKVVRSAKESDGQLAYGTEQDREIAIHDLKKQYDYQKALEEIREAELDQSEDEIDLKCTWATLRSMEAIAMLTERGRSEN